MTPVFGARRRAEEFHSLVEDTSTGGLHDARYADFLDIVATLRDAPVVEPRQDFVSTLREQLMAEAQTVLVADPAEARLALPSRRTTRRTARERRIAAAAAGFAIVGATTSMAMAAQSALPGDALYPLKRLIEGAETGVAVDEADKGVTLLANATGRLEEITALSRDGQTEDGAAIADTFNAFTRQAIEASDLLLADYAATGDESSIAELRDFTGASMETLAELEAVVPDEARDELLRAARILTQIDAQAQQACPSCGGDGITDIPAILTSSFESSDSVAATPGTVLKASPKNRKKGSGDGATSLPQTSGPLPPGSVLSPAGGADTGTSSGDGGSQDGSSGPVDELTKTLTGGGSEPASGPSVPELPDPGPIVDDVTDPLLNP
ncbi:DUF5667 domain-containing protein [Nocardioides sp.]|uniref:DUF5667 domain-containing protein n=1 Tax=Nocardioides sp. TaxID=35761 RepID=UPI002D7F0088|nr:DUF5667 domain-containing protein [Nocardioides sp.]HET8961823.1 DUF5667 domain-containing protein [Nocardioides sp.]